MTEPDFETLRREFPVLARKTYLNSGSYCALANEVKLLINLELAKPEAYAFLSSGSVSMLNTKNPGTPSVVHERWQARQPSFRLNAGTSAAFWSSV